MHIVRFVHSITLYLSWGKPVVIKKKIVLFLYLSSCSQILNHFLYSSIINVPAYSKLPSKVRSTHRR